MICLLSDKTNYATDTSNLSINLCATHNDNKKDDEDTKVCCILDSVNCLMIVRRSTFTDECNLPKLKEIQDCCTSYLVKILKLYKVIIYPKV